MPGPTTYDTLIVGGGSSGCVLANRLSADPSHTVLLLEAGPDYGPNPAAWPSELRYSPVQALESHSWNLHDRQTGAFLPRARVLGGQSAVNACYWIRGSAADYDAWETLGNPGWGFADLLPYFKQAESDPLGGPMHGTDGPVPIFREQNWSPGDAAFAEAAANLGLEEIADINGAPEQFPCVCPGAKNLIDGDRASTVMTYLNPVRPRPNLTIRPDTLIDRVLFDGATAIGVVTSTGETIHANQIVLAAGAYFTPGILMRSGIGDERELHTLGIPVRQHLPGVGQNLLDHPLAVMVMQGTLAPGAEPDGQTLGQTMIKGRASSSSEDIDFHIYNGQYFDEPLQCWVFHSSVSLMHARSTGTVRLASADPTALPLIEHQHYADPADLDRMCDALEFARTLYQTAPLSAILTLIPERTWSWATRDQLRHLILTHIDSTNHCSGTAKMGPPSDLLAVADPTGRVYGARNLRIADSSLFPTCPRANIHFPVIAVAEKIAAAL